MVQSNIEAGREPHGGVRHNLTPVMAALISFFLLKEPLGWQFWTGMVLVIGGVVLARFGDRLAKR